MPVKYRLKTIFACFLLSLCFCMANAQVKKRVKHRPKVDSAALDLNSHISDSILNEKEIKTRL